MKPVSQPLTREQAQVAFTHITHGKFALDDVNFWEAAQRDFAGKCWHWELKSDSEKWGVITLDRTHFIHMAQYMEAGDRFAHVGSVSSLKIYNLIKEACRKCAQRASDDNQACRKSDKENEQ